MRNVKVTDMDIQRDVTSATSYKVYAATYGRGLFSGTFTNTVLSQEDLVLLKGIKLYPNPSNGLVNISIENYTGSLTIEVYDLNGRKVRSNATNFSTESSINLQGLPSGIYIVKLQGEGISHSEKVVLN
jgi:hypothetical protein